MKNIIKIDISLYIIVFLSLLAGNFKEIIILNIIIFIHEIGHIYWLKYFNKEIIEVKFYIFGGITKYNSLVNHKIKEELLIASSGIINQLILFLFFYVLYRYNIINNYTYDLFMRLNISLIIFNILPIIGLDGEKILHLLLELFIPYKKVNNISIIISIISLVFLIINSISLKFNIIFVLSFLLYKILFFIRNKKYLENKFLLERYLYDIPYNRIKYLKNNNLNNLYQDTYHFLKFKKEYKCLKEWFQNY